MISNKEKKYIKSLQIKKYRQQHQAFLVEGWKSVEELLDSNYEVELLFVSEKYENLCNGVVLNAKEINEISSLANNQDAIAVVKMPNSNIKVQNDHPIFIFDGIQDPGNLGTIVRTADWLGYSNIICSKDSVDFYNPKVISSTKGSFLRVIPQYLDLIEFLNQENSKRIVLADLDGIDFKKSNLDNNTIVVFGGESLGIREDIRTVYKERITIPKRGEAESLNVAMSFGIIASSI